MTGSIRVVVIALLLACITSPVFATVIMPPPIHTTNIVRVNTVMLWFAMMFLMW